MRPRKPSTGRRRSGSQRRRVLPTDNAAADDVATKLRLDLQARDAIIASLRQQLKTQKNVRRRHAQDQLGVAGLGLPMRTQSWAGPRRRPSWTSKQLLHHGRPPPIAVPANQGHARAFNRTGQKQSTSLRRALPPSPLPEAEPVNLVVMLAGSGPLPGTPECGDTDALGEEDAMAMDDSSASTVDEWQESPMSPMTPRTPRTPVECGYHRHDLDGLEGLGLGSMVQTTNIGNRSRSQRHHGHQHHQQREVDNVLMDQDHHTFDHRSPDVRQRVLASRLQRVADTMLALENPDAHERQQQQERVLRRPPGARKSMTRGVSRAQSFTMFRPSASSSSRSSSTTATRPGSRVQINGGGRRTHNDSGVPGQARSASFVYLGGSSTFANARAKHLFAVERTMESTSGEPMTPAVDMVSNSGGDDGNQPSESKMSPFA